MARPGGREQGLGLAPARELFAADALHHGRLVRLSLLALPDDAADAFWLVYPPALAEGPPLVALRGWLKDELAQSQAAMHQPQATAAQATRAQAAGASQRRRPPKP